MAKIFLKAILLQKYMKKTNTPEPVYLPPLIFPNITQALFQGILYSFKSEMGKKLGGEGRTVRAGAWYDN